MSQQKTNCCSYNNFNSMYIMLFDERGDKPKGKGKTGKPLERGGFPLPFMFFPSLLPFSFILTPFAQARKNQVFS